MSMYNKLEKYIREASSDTGFACSHWAGNGAVAELEAKLCSLYGAKHALCVDSATNGLMYLLLASGLKRSEIMTTALSFGGTIAGALNLGCTFSFADIDESLCINTEAVKALLPVRPKTKAIIAVDYAGIPHQMKAIDDICKEYGLFHFVDAAQSMGAKYNQPDVAALNDAMVVSFGGGKAIFAGGEGGAIIMDNSDLYDALLYTCQHAHRQERDLGIGMSHEFALNGRMHPIAALLACENFESGLLAIQKRREVMLRGLSILSSFDSVSSILQQENSSFYHCPFFVKDRLAFKSEFEESNLGIDYFYSKAEVELLPQQLIRAGLCRRIKAKYCPRIDCMQDELFFLHIKPQHNHE